MNKLENEGRNNENKQQATEKPNLPLRILLRQNESKRGPRRRKTRSDMVSSFGEWKQQMAADKVTEVRGERVISRENLQCISSARKSFIEAITSEKLSRFVDQQAVGTPHRGGSVKLTKSDYRKMHINEILKGHAQKIHANSSRSCVQMKERPLPSVELQLSKVKSHKNASDKEVLENKIDVSKEGKKTQVSDEKSRNEQTNNENENLNAPIEIVVVNQKVEEKRNVEEKETDIKGDVIDIKTSKASPTDNEKEDKKTTVVNKWIGYPQSIELKGRLQGLWKNNLLFQEDGLKHQEEDKVRVSDEEEKKEKRRTYTDRLVMPKTRPKSEKREDTEDKKKMDETKMHAFRDLSSNINKTFPLPPPVPHAAKDNSHAPEVIFKPRGSRSAELRDLVNYAAREHKIFCIFDNHWYIVRPVREELLNRGWLEVIPDRRLIPRRRPPPTGPLVDREKLPVDRNCNTIEAILTAKEIFMNELEETVVNSATLRTTTNKSRMSLTPTIPTKRISELSLKESNSLFRIMPPTSEKKKSNFEIREFVTKCMALVPVNPEKIGKAGKEKKEGKTGKKTKDTGKASKNKAEDKATISEPTPLAPNLQTMLDTVGNDKKTIRQAIAEKSENECDTLPVPSKQAPNDHLEESKKEEKDTQPGGMKVSLKESDAKAISKIIQSTNVKIHFMWLSIKPAIHLKCFNYSPEIINKFQKTSFCTKIGLWNHLNNIQWYAHEVHFPAKSPRMYNTGEADDLQAFFQDFQLTACIGLLKWLADTFFDRGIKAVQTKKGKVPLRAFEFAIKQCERYMKFKENEDLSALDESKALQEEWNTFLQWFYTITNDHGKLQESSNAQVMVVYTKAVETLRLMRKHWPEMDIDGRLNMWIMKPYCASCGRGIFMTNNVYYIGQHSKYIVQKYIERPLLIYNTKFDIRQWFMITKLTPLEIWMYKECYLRFCTQPFALRNLHESVHLSNNSVQRKYINRLDTSLSDQNMWDSATFQMYLNTIGHPNAWKEVIYPGMKDAIVSIMLSAQDNFDGPRRNWFEVYGADFMLSANVKDGPWLIEINENPAMDPSTKVTARLCPQMLRDVIKVVVDKRANKNASTGQWELIYRQNYSPSFTTVDLDVKGKKIARIPTSMKGDISNTVPGSESAHYEVIKSLNDAPPVQDAEKNGEKKVDRLLYRKEHERYRLSGEINSAKALIDKVLEEDGGKTLKTTKNSTSKSYQETIPVQKSMSTKNWLRDDVGVQPSVKQNEKDHPESSNLRFTKTLDEICDEDKFKFTKFYKV